MDCVTRAQKKLDRIIEREGDLNGERCTPEYFQMLVEEEIRADAVSKQCLDTCITPTRSQNGQTGCKGETTR